MTGRPKGASSGRPPRRFAFIAREAGMDVPQADFDAIYDRHRPGVIRHLARFVGEHEAEDLSQEVFVKVARGLKDFRGDSRLSTWIYRIATNAALDRLRKSSDRAGGAMGKGVRAEKACAAGEERGGPPCDGGEGSPPSALRQLMRKEMNACLLSRIGILPEPYRSAIVQGDLGEMRNAEIAALTGDSLDAVKMRRHRARARLKEDLERHCRLTRDESDGLVCVPK